MSYPEIHAGSITVATLRPKNQTTRSSKDNKIHIAIGGVSPTDKRDYLHLMPVAKAEEVLRGKQGPDDSWVRRPIVPGTGNVVSVFDKARRTAGPILPNANGTVPVDEIIEGFAIPGGFATGPYVGVVSPDRKIITREDITSLWVLTTLVVGGLWQFSGQPTS